MAERIDVGGYLLAHYQKQTLRQIARDLGMRHSTVQRRFARLVEEGQADPAKRFYHRPWTPAEKRWLVEHIGRGGWSIPHCAKRLGRSEAAVRVRLKKLRVRKPIGQGGVGTLSLRGLMEVMGLGGNHDRAREWITAGLLRASRAPEAGERKTVRIYAADLVEFLQHHPEAYDYDRIPDRLPGPEGEVAKGKPNPYRIHARRAASATAGYLTAKQAARRLGRGVENLRLQISRGRLHAVHLPGRDIHPEEWFITPAEVERFRREWCRSTEEKIRAGFLESRRDLSQTISDAEKDAIAARCGCSRSTVARALALARKERGMASREALRGDRRRAA